MTMATYPKNLFLRGSRKRYEAEALLPVGVRVYRALAP